MPARPVNQHNQLFRIRRTVQPHRKWIPIPHLSCFRFLRCFVFSTPVKSKPWVLGESFDGHCDRISPNAITRYTIGIIARLIRIFTNMVFLSSVVLKHALPVVAQLALWADIPIECDGFDP